MLKLKERKLSRLLIAYHYYWWLPGLLVTLHNLCNWTGSNKCLPNNLNFMYVAAVSINALTARNLVGIGQLFNSDLSAEFWGKQYHFVSEHVDQGSPQISFKL